jgi:hypothetical protein
MWREPDVGPCVRCSSLFPLFVVSSQSDLPACASDIESRADTFDSRPGLWQEVQRFTTQPQRARRCLEEQCKPGRAALQSAQRRNHKRRSDSPWFGCRCRLKLHFCSIGDSFVGFTNRTTHLRQRCSADTQRLRCRELHRFHSPSDIRFSPGNGLQLSTHSCVCSEGGDVKWTTGVLLYRSTRAANLRCAFKNN